MFSHFSRFYLFVYIDNMTKTKLHENQRFNNKNEYKFVMKKWIRNIQRKYRIRKFLRKCWKMNCKNNRNCFFRMRINSQKNENYVCIIVIEHICFVFFHYNWKNFNDSQFIVDDKFVQTHVQENRFIRFSNIAHISHKQKNRKLKYMSSFRAHKKIFVWRNENENESYQYFSTMIEIMNICAETKLKIDNRIDKFERLWILSNATKKIMKHFRHFVTIDDTHTKFFKQMTLLTFIFVNAQNQTLSIIWTVMRNENKINWNWFLKEIISHFSTLKKNDAIVINDRNKDIASVFVRRFRETMHVYCTQHFEKNVVVMFDRSYKKLFMNAVYVKNKTIYLKIMKIIRVNNARCVNYIEKIRFNKWIKHAFFVIKSRYDHYISNIQEFVNFHWLKTRKLSITIMCINIWTTIMTQMSDKKIRVHRRDENKFIDFVKKYLNDQAKMTSIYDC